MGLNWKCDFTFSSLLKYVIPKQLHLLRKIGPALQKLETEVFDYTIFFFLHDKGNHRLLGGKIIKNKTIEIKIVISTILDKNVWSLPSRQWSTKLTFRALTFRLYCWNELVTPEKSAFVVFLQLTIIKHFNLQLIKTRYLPTRRCISELVLKTFYDLNLITNSFSSVVQNLRFEKYKEEDILSEERLAEGTRNCASLGT